jgi:crotonobetainyl-CoA:carnitine CoA-transferase CaiB-like acyl-CoA transferase
MANMALQGIKVLELSTFVAAPSCARLLADFGAEVIKIESKNGDAWRYFGTTLNVPASEIENPIFDIVNSNKKSISVDIKSEEGLEVVHKLVSQADIFITNIRPKSLANIGLNYESLKENYPRLIYGSISGFGDQGPDVDKPGFDVVAYWARSGFMADLVKPDEYPVYTPIGFGDVTVGMTLFAGLMSALYNREKTGLGDKVSASLFGSSIWFAGTLITSSQDKYHNKFPKARLEGNPLAIPYRCKDNEWLLLTIIEFDRYYSSFCNALEIEFLLEDEKYSTKPKFYENRADVIPIIEQAFLSRTSAEWKEIFDSKDIVNDRLRHFNEVTTDEQALANGYIIEHCLDNGDKCVVPATPIKSAHMSKAPFERAPLLGEDTYSILKELGYMNEEINALNEKEIIKLRNYQ